MASIAANRPDHPANTLLIDAFHALYAEARRVGAPTMRAAESWSAAARPTYAEMHPVVDDLARQPALAPHRPSGRPHAPAVVE